ncbi:MAG: rRNA maturation RNase YbeY [Gemmatimonadetes bacterium]|nr:rRNA maturation RNase YbeY [Gemmatimonadota bacterium]
MSRWTILVNDGTGAGDGAGPSAELHDRIRAAVARTLDTGLVTGEALTSAELSITLVAPERMRQLNREYHGVDGPTDVLSFPLGPQTAATDADTSLLGDVYLCPAVASEAALEHGVDLPDELVRLAIHGALHLLGHDHPESMERYDSEMFRLQERLLAELGRATE